MSGTNDVAYLRWIRRDRELEAARSLSNGAEQLVTGPTKEPVTLDEVKRHLRVSVDDENPLIDRYIRAARRSLENHLQWAFLTQTWDFVLDEPPYYSAPILLPRAPLASVVSITSYDTLNAGTVFGTSNYVVDTNSKPGRIGLNVGCIWPAPSNGLRETSAIIVRYTCGYTQPENVPDELTTALLLWIGTLYETRQHIGENPYFEVPEYIRDLCSDYRLVRV